MLKVLYTDFVKEQDGDQRKLFKVTKALLLPEDEICFPLCHDNTALANDIARYFHRKITNIRNELDSIDTTQNRCGELVDDPIFNKNLKPLNAFKVMSESEVYQLIQASAKKSCTLDPPPTFLLMSSLDELLPSITRIVNCSMTLGHFPTEWKAALVQ